MESPLSVKVGQWMAYLEALIAAVFGFYGLYIAFPILTGMEALSNSLIAWGVTLLVVSVQVALEGRLVVRNRRRAKDQSPWIIRAVTFVALICIVAVGFIWDPQRGLSPAELDSSLFYSAMTVASAFLLTVLCLTIVMLPKFSNYAVATTGEKPKRGDFWEAEDEGSGDHMVEIPPPLRKRK